ncbi:hypothetical protein [Coralloluteibacterium thermophilus]|uniref:EF-hand domain-containing protein n=1 Tax=Coralloluteibacterium thermophilum TaxID=2707049 RepID=A0ABV9NEQ9_9GAMM
MTPASIRAAVAAAVLAAGPVLATDHMSWDQLDADGDGRVSREEAGGHERLAAEWDAIDTDGDGTISQAEYEVWRSADHAQDAEREADDGDDHEHHEDTTREE